MTEREMQELVDQVVLTIKAATAPLTERLARLEGELASVKNALVTEKRLERLERTLSLADISATDRGVQ